MCQCARFSLKELAGLKFLHSLTLGGTMVTHAGLKELAGLKLTNLEVFSKVTDDELTELAKLKSLRSLSLARTDATSFGLKELAGLGVSAVVEPRLHVPFGFAHGAGQTEIVAGTGHRRGLEQCPVEGVAPAEILADAGHSLQAVTDDGLRHLAGLDSVHTLDLGGTWVKGPGLENLAGLKSLESLTLGLLTTDKSLKHLAGLKSLRSLTVSGHVTNAGVKELAKLQSMQSLQAWTSAKRR